MYNIFNYCLNIYGDCKYDCFLHYFIINLFFFYSKPIMATPLDLDTSTLVSQDPPRPSTISEPYWEVDDSVQSQLLPFRYGANSYGNFFY